MILPCNIQDEIDRLKKENARLTALLEVHGISWKAEERLQPKKQHNSTNITFSTDEKVALFRSLLCGRTDVYPIRWESISGKSGYTPACGNEWQRRICEKPRVKCSQCEYRELLPVTNRTIYDHLAGKQTIGVYPLLLYLSYLKYWY